MKITRYNTRRRNSKTQTVAFGLAPSNPALGVSGRQTPEPLIGVAFNGAAKESERYQLLLSPSEAIILGNRIAQLGEEYREANNHLREIVDRQLAAAELVAIETSYIHGITPDKQERARKLVAQLKQLREGGPTDLPKTVVEADDGTPMLAINTHLLGHGAPTASDVTDDAPATHYVTLRIVKDCPDPAMPDEVLKAWLEDWFDGIDYGQVNVAHLWSHGEINPANLPLLELMKEVEWMGTNYTKKPNETPAPVSCCPWCGGIAPSDEGAGHSDGCKMKTLVADLVKGAPKKEKTDEGQGAVSGEELRARSGT